MYILRPMLAAKIEDESQICYPLLASPKVDGIRALKIGQRMVSRNFKPIPNKYINELLTSICPEGIDGELICSFDSFQATTSGVMSEYGRPKFKYLVFDWVQEIQEGLAQRYSRRLKDLLSWWECLPDIDKAFVQPLPQVVVKDWPQLEALEKSWLEQGWEGVMLRRPTGHYKCGRSTLKEHLLMKLKRFVEDEAEVVGFERQFTNLNEAKKDEFGLQKRSSHQANLIGTDLLGALICRAKDGVIFNIGTGMDDALRLKLWKDKDTLIGKQVTYKSFPKGVLQAPRFPVFKAFREDL